MAAPKFSAGFLLAFLLLPLLSCSQHINRYRHQEKQGKWIIYHDSAETKIDNVGRYRRGNPKGKWKFYDEAGYLTKTELYRFRTISTAYYYPNGKIRKKGKAKQVEEGLILHYYYDGYWMLYDSTGSPVRKQLYQKGHKISETALKTEAGSSINDSLISALQLINSNIFIYQDSISAAEQQFGKDSKQYQRAISLNRLNSSRYLSKLDTLIQQYGYPGKTLTGKEYAIAFSLISAANLSYKEKYLKLVTDAADKGELDWSDVAFFVDKIKVAKKEKQVYCTQFVYDEQQRKLIYYPLENPEQLNARRKQAGLDELNIGELSFSEY
jgi:hypothetical protein